MGTCWAQYWANRYQWALKVRNDISPEDLLQAAYLGELIAKRKYTPDKGAFTTFSAFYIRSELRALIGIRRGEIPPTTASLDKPLPDGENTLADVIPDDKAPDMDDELYKRERAEGVRAAIERIENTEQRKAVSMCYLEGKGSIAIAEKLGVSVQAVYDLIKKGRQSMRRDRLLQRLVNLDWKVPYYAHVGVTQFQNTNTSAVEMALLILEREREKIKTYIEQEK